MHAAGILFVKIMHQITYQSSFITTSVSLVRNKRSADTHPQPAEEPQMSPSSDCIAHRLRTKTGTNVASHVINLQLRDYYRIACRDLRDNEVQEQYLGSMDKKCIHCEALHFEAERTKSTKIFPNCCHNGTVKISPPEIPDELKALLDGTSRHSSHFITNIRSYNSSFAFASLQTNVERFHGSAPSFFMIHGQLYHRIGSLNPRRAESSSYSQLYILDPSTALQLRVARNQQCHREIMEQLDTMLRRCNPYAKAYKMMKEVEDETSQQNPGHGAPHVSDLHSRT